MRTEALRFRGSLAASVLPSAGAVEGNMVRLDVSRQHIRVEKDDRLAIVQTPPNKDFIQYEIVFGHTYAGGDFYR
jgi:hypothetical protein